MAILTAPMPTEAVAIDAQTVGDEALKINATLNKMTTTIAGVWDLDVTTNEIPKTISVPHINAGQESTIEN